MLNITSPQSNLRKAHRKGPVGNNGMPQIHPQNCSFTFDDHHQNLVTHTKPDPTHHPKRHTDPISRFATIHFPNRPTDRPTDRWYRQQAHTMSAPLAMLIESDALIKYKTRRRSESAYIRQVNYIGLRGRWNPVKTESISRAIFEITGLKDIRIMTLTFKGHVTSSMTSSFNPP